MELPEASGDKNENNLSTGDYDVDDYYECLKIKKHFDFIDVNKDGYTILASSSLTTRQWSADLWLFKDAKHVPDLSKCVAFHTVDDCGVSCVKFLDGLAIRAILCQDNGAVEVVGWEESDVSYSTTNMTNGHNRGSSDASWNGGAGDNSADNDKTANRLQKMVSHGCCREHDGAVLCVDTLSARDSDPARAVTGATDGCVKLWDLETLVSERTYRDAHCHWVTGVAASPSQPHLFVSCSLDGSVLMWDTRAQQCPASYLVCGEVGRRATCVSWSPLDVTSVAVGWYSGHVSVHNVLAPGDDGVRGAIYDRPIHALKWHHSRPWLACCADECLVNVLHVQKDTLTAKYSDSVHTDMVRGLCWSPGKDELVSCGWDGQSVCRTIAD